MSYTKIVKGKNHKHTQAYITKSESSYNSLLSGIDKASRISKNDAKGYIRDYIQDNKNKLKNTVIHISYITDQGTVNLNDNVFIQNQVTENDMNKLLGDPKTNKNEASGEYNNELQHKTIYGVSITTFEVPKAKTTTTTRPTKTRSRFNFVFE